MQESNCQSADHNQRELMSSLLKSQCEEVIRQCNESIHSSNQKSRSSNLIKIVIQKDLTEQEKQILNQFITKLEHKIVQEFSSNISKLKFMSQKKQFMPDQPEETQKVQLYPPIEDPYVVSMKFKLETVTNLLQKQIKEIAELKKENQEISQQLQVYKQRVFEQEQATTKIMIDSKQKISAGKENCEKYTLQIQKLKQINSNVQNQLQEEKRQRQKMQNKNKQLQTQVEQSNRVKEQLNNQVKRFQQQILELKQYIQKQSQKTLILDIEIEDLKNKNKDLETQMQIFKQKIQRSQNISEEKDLKLKQLDENINRLKEQLQKIQKENEILVDNVNKQTSLADNSQKAEVENRKLALRLNQFQQITEKLHFQIKQKTQKLKQLQQEKDKLQNQFKKEINMKVIQFEEQLEKTKTENNTLQCKLQEKVKLGNINDGDKVVYLKNKIQKYQADIETKNYQLQNLNTQFKQKMRIKQSELVYIKAQMQQINKKNALLQQKASTYLQSQTKQKRLHLFFQLLKGFKVKMSASQFNTLRLKIGLLMN